MTPSHPPASGFLGPKVPSRPSPGVFLRKGVRTTKQPLPTRKYSFASSDRTCVCVFVCVYIIFFKWRTNVESHVCPCACDVFYFLCAAKKFQYPDGRRKPSVVRRNEVTPRAEKKRTNYIKENAVAAITSSEFNLQYCMQGNNHFTLILHIYVHCEYLGKPHESQCVR